MKHKKIIGLISFIIGVILLSYGFYGKGRMSEARGDIDATTKYIPKIFFKGKIKGKLHSEVDKYRLPVTLCFLGGMFFVVGGGFLVYLGKKKSK
jgi:hypothetical protein